MKILFNEAQNFGINLTREQIEKFKIYMDFLLEYNTHTNLTAIKNPEDVMIKHFLDSIILDKFLNIKSGAHVVDIGTGAGFPGVPLKILRKDINFTLIDGLNKRVVFLNRLSEKLDIKFDVYHARAEELSKMSKFREKFDIATSRAVAPLNVLSEYCLPYVSCGGVFAALKGPESEQEIKNALPAIKKLGGKFVKSENFELPLSKGFRKIIIVDKMKSTELCYPRSNSQISKKPL